MKAGGSELEASLSHIGRPYQKTNQPKTTFKTPVTGDGHTIPGTKGVEQLKVLCCGEENEEEIIEGNNSEKCGLKCKGKEITMYIILNSIQNLTNLEIVCPW